MTPANSSASGRPLSTDRHVGRFRQLSNKEDQNSMQSSTSDPNVTTLYAHVVLDRSGSMTACADDAVGGYNTYVRNLPANTRVSLTLFDTGGIDLVRDAVAPTA